jgi:condensin complex subunit 1
MTPMKTPQRARDAMDVDEENMYGSEFGGYLEEGDFAVNFEVDGDEDADFDDTLVHSMLIDDGPEQTPLQTPLQTPKRTPFRTPKTPHTAKSVAVTPKPKKHKKAKPRKSELDLAALTNEQAALAALDSNQTTYLRLRKRYYAEAMNFIRQLEDAMEVLGRLLGSTNKAEVFESMEFFRVAYEYQFDGAQVSCYSYA